jgi:hypothetical protein
MSIVCHRLGPSPPSRKVPALPRRGSPRCRASAPVAQGLTSSSRTSGAAGRLSAAQLMERVGGSSCSLLSGDVAVLSCCTDTLPVSFVSAASCSVPTRRPSAFQTPYHCRDARGCMKLAAGAPTSPHDRQRLVRGALPALGQLQTPATIPRSERLGKEFPHRWSGCPAQARTSESSWLFTVACGRWWLPSLPSRLPSGREPDLPYQV